MSTVDQDPVVVEALRQNTIAVSSRLSALSIYGVMGLLVGVLMLLGGAPGLLEQEYGPVIRYWLGGSSSIGGLLLIVGSIETARNPHGGWWASFLGTLTFAAWTAAFAWIYGKVGVEQGFVVAAWMEPIPRLAPRPYIPALYLCIALVALLHIVTLLRLRLRPRAR